MGEDIKGVYGLYNSHELNYSVVDGKKRGHSSSMTLVLSYMCVCVFACAMKRTPAVT